MYKLHRYVSVALLAVVISAVAAIACTQEKIVVQTVEVQVDREVRVVETVVVEKETIVEGETVVQTVVVERERVVEGQTVVETVVVEKEVVVQQEVAVEVEKGRYSDRRTNGNAASGSWNRGSARCRA